MAINALTDMLGQVVRIRHSITFFYSPLTNFVNANPFFRHIVALKLVGLIIFILYTMPIKGEIGEFFLFTVIYLVFLIYIFS